MRWIVWSWVLFSPVVYAWTDAEVRSQVDTAIRDRHPQYSKEWWQGLGENAPRVILQMITENTEVSRQVNLTQALAWYDDPDAMEYLKREALESDVNVRRNAAIRSIGRSPRGSEQTEFLSGFLEHSNPHTRLEAARALQAIGVENPSAKLQEKLSAFRKKEKAVWVVKDLDKVATVVKKTNILSEKLDNRWQGQWTGYWVQDAGEGLSSETLKLELVLEGAQDSIRGTLNVGAMKWKLSPSTGALTKIQANFLEPDGKTIRKLGLQLRPMGKDLYLFGETTWKPGVLWLKKQKS